VTAYSWKQHAEINLKAMKFLLKFQWVVRGVTVCPAKNYPLKKN
jgi:hypothetical protein